MFVNTSLCFRKKKTGEEQKGNSTSCVESYLSFPDLLCALLSPYLPHAGGAEVIRQAAWVIVCVSVAPQPPNLGSFFKDLRVFRKVSNNFFFVRCSGLLQKNIERRKKRYWSPRKYSVSNVFGIVGRLYPVYN